MVVLIHKVCIKSCIDCNEAENGQKMRVHKLNQ